MAFVRIWSAINFTGTSTDLDVGPINLPYTVNSVEVAPYYCVTVFDRANYTGNSETYFSNSVNTSSFSEIRSIIVQDSLVPYHNDYDKTVISTNQNEMYFALNRNINLQEDNTEYDTEFIYLQRDNTNHGLVKTNWELVITDIMSIVIPKGFYAKFTDNNGQSITFYNSVYFLDAFKNLKINSFSSTSTIKYMDVFMKNPPCYVTDPCSTCQICPTCPTCPSPTCPTCPSTTCEPCPKCEATSEACKMPSTYFFKSINTVYIILGVLFTSVFFIVVFFHLK